jgi:predicted PurR-regulated permease PerM
MQWRDAVHEHRETLRRNRLRGSAGTKAAVAVSPASCASLPSRDSPWMARSRETTDAPVAHTGVLTRERVTTIALLASTAIGLYLCYRIIHPFLPALTWALALAVVARPVHHAIARRIPHSGSAAAISVTLVTLLLLAPAVLLTWEIVSQAAAYGNTLEEVEQGAGPERIEALLGNYPRVGQAVTWLRRNVQLEQGLRQVFSRVGDRLTSAVSGTVWVAVQLLITLLLLFFLFRDEAAALEAVRDYLPLSPQESDHVLQRVDDTIHATIYGTIVVAAVQGAMGGLMFWWLGLPAPVFWGFIMAAMALIPYLGAFVIWGPAAVYLAMQGNWVQAVILTVWGTVFIGLIDNILYPLLVGRRLRQHTMVAFFAIIGGFAAFGASGIVLGPVIVTTTAALINIWWRRTARGNAADAQTEQPARARAAS